MDHEHHNMQMLPGKPKLRDYIPLGIIIGFILASTVTFMAATGFSLQHFLAYSMGFFFLYFAMFKMLDLMGFAYGYHDYDLIAQRFMPWGWIYPFVEAGLGILYLLGLNQPWLNLLTILLAFITCLSVGIKLAKREQIMCACLGTVLKVPLTYVSLVEYALMGLMAVVMLFI